MSRDDPLVIRTRIRLVAVSIILCTSVTYFVLIHHLSLPPHVALHTLGFWPVNVASLLRPLLLTALLFAGPLFEYAIIDSGWRNHDMLVATLSSWAGFRNYIAGPVTEEILFRSLLVAVHLRVQNPSDEYESSPSATGLVFVTPLYFGIAHIHHYYEFRLTHPSVSALPALVRSLVQFGYTTVFGWYATFLFLRTGNVFAVMLVHTFCNWMGLPRLWGRVGRYVTYTTSASCNEEVGLIGSTEMNWELGICWTWAYYLVLVGGATAWWKTLWFMTESEAALVMIR